MATKKNTPRCQTPKCRRLARNSVGGKHVCGKHMGPAVVESKRKSVSIKVGKDKASQDAMTSMLLAMRGDD